MKILTVSGFQLGPVKWVHKVPWIRNVPFTARLRHAYPYLHVKEKFLKKKLSQVPINILTVQPTRFLSFNIIFQFQTVRIKVARPVKFPPINADSNSIGKDRKSRRLVGSFIVITSGNTYRYTAHTLPLTTLGTLVMGHNLWPIVWPMKLQKQHRPDCYLYTFRSKNKRRSNSANKIQK